MINSLVNELVTLHWSVTALFCLLARRGIAVATLNYLVSFAYYLAR